MSKIAQFIKRETVLSVAMVLAVVSLFFVPPDVAYLGYVDYKVLALLFCLMTIMAGFQETGLFGKLAEWLLGRVHTFRQLYLVLVFLCFFCSMWITNDVALLTFVPFTILVLRMAGLEQEMIPVIVSQTIAANLGSMTTPVGNPQNLYLYSVSGMTIGEFLKVMGPLTLLSFGMILLMCFCHKSYPVEVTVGEQNSACKTVKAPEEPGTQPTLHTEKKKTNHRYKTVNVLLGCLFLLSLLSVLRVLPWQVLLGVTLLVCVLLKAIWKVPFLPGRVDYSLLLTFVAFFLFIGNMGRIPRIKDFLSNCLEGREVLLSFGCSQIISNVPTAILLSGFTDQYAALLQGVNIGGLGTLIASLASLISYKFFAKISGETTKVGTKGSYLFYFTIWNVGMAVVLLLATYKFF